MRRVSEQQRLAAIRRYDILDTPPDGAFDRITAIAARVASAPISVISIVDSDRIWFKSRHGITTEQVDRTPGLCSSAIIRRSTLVINDASRDPQALANPLVAGEFGLRFYVGAPLITSDGFKLGTLCVIDKVPRQLSVEQLAILKVLASVVIDEMELRLSARTAIKRLEEEVRTDYLTGLPNRRHFTDWLESPIGHSRRARGPFCLAIIDIDHFKSINDSLGHATGDRVIKEVAMIIQSRLPSTDFAIRWGGDEFVAVTTGTICQAKLVLTDLRTAISTHLIDSLAILVSVSIGVTEFRENEPDHQVIERADAALYKAKKEGRDRVLSS